MTKVQIDLATDSVRTYINTRQLIYRFTYSLQAEYDIIDLKLATMLKSFLLNIHFYKQQKQSNTTNIFILKYCTYIHIYLHIITVAINRDITVKYTY